MLSQEVGNVSAVWEHKCSENSNRSIKVRCDLKRNLSFAIKNSLHEYGTYVFGVHVHEFGGANRFTYGVQLDLNL